MLRTADRRRSWKSKPGQPADSARPAKDAGQYIRGGIAWTASDINNTGFGFEMKSSPNYTNGITPPPTTISVQNYLITVKYTPPASAVSCTTFFGF